MSIKMDSPHRYVVGFLFSEDRKKLALIRKTHPEWQAGLLNGPDGKVEPQEHVTRAMEREFLEETGYLKPDCSWELFCVLSGNNIHYKGEPGHEVGDDFEVYFFYATGDVRQLESKTEEKIEVIDVCDLGLERTVSNLHWLIPMALSMNLSPCEIYRIAESYIAEFGR
jgi:8-oxo-dGTP pyrophosphatase MutT (NUDIX family)